jgi:hypothetical protein
MIGVRARRTLPRNAERPGGIFDKRGRYQRAGGLR